VIATCSSWFTCSSKSGAMGCSLSASCFMSIGNSQPPEQAFRGRDVDSNALMRDRGFPVI
jgi:hypothetical protein